MIHNIQSVSSIAALRLLEAALSHAAAAELSVAVCLCDAQGHVLASARMDGVTPPILTFAQDKAYTAATMRRTTAAFGDRMGSSQSLTLGLSTRERLLSWGGGLPIVHQGKVIGGIGVSGAKDFEDIACAEAALTDQNFGWEI
ncbi:MAG: heme-binding protein [Marivivens sp.]|nr:heme-binding protein [Marivivens sp.]